MSNVHIIATVTAMTLAAVPAPGVMAQSGAPGATWETLASAPIPESVEPILNINSLTLPAEPVPRVTQPHTHTGPVVAYIVAGEIENQIEPDPPAVHKPGSFFLEPPMHVHRIIRNLSATRPATLIISQVGRTRVPESLLRTLEEAAPARLLESQHQWQAPLRTTVNQEFRAFRLTIPVDSTADARAHTGPGFAYVLDGTIRASAASVPQHTYRAGDLFLTPSFRSGLAFRNASSQPAMLLIYQVSERTPSQ